MRVDVIRKDEVLRQGLLQVPVFVHPLQQLVVPQHPVMLITTGLLQEVRLLAGMQGLLQAQGPYEGVLAQVFPKDHLTHVQAVAVHLHLPVQAVV